jgi:hypothetical protein
MVFGLAALNAVLAQGAFRVGELTKEQATLTEQNGEMRREIDDMSSPARLTSEASKAGLIFPDTQGIQVVHVGAVTGSTSSGHKKDSKSSATNAIPAGTPAARGNGTPTSLPGGPE